MSGSDDDGSPVLANHPFVDTDDPAAARARISALLVPHQLEVHRGLLPFRAVYRFAALDGLSFHYLRYEPEVTMAWAPPRHFRLLAIVLTGAARVRHERRRIEIEPGHCFILPPAMAPRLDLIGNCEALFVKIPDTKFQGGMALAASDFETRGTIRDKALVDFVRFICRDLDHATPLTAPPMAATRLEDLLLETLLATCSGGRREPSRAPRNVRRCEEFIALHAAEPITIADMTRVSGASERMLFHEFRGHRDTSPMAHLKRVRLERVHADLVASGPGHRTVSQIATAWGFAHPGRFAKDYRARFGRKPSDTLRRAANPGYHDAKDAQRDGQEHGE